MDDDRKHIGSMPAIKESVEVLYDKVISSSPDNYKAYRAQYQDTETRFAERLELDILKNKIEANREIQNNMSLMSLVTGTLMSITYEPLVGILLIGGGIIADLYGSISNISKNRRIRRYKKMARKVLESGGLSDLNAILLLRKVAFES